MRRHPLHVFYIAVFCTITIPIVLPFMLAFSVIEFLCPKTVFRAFHIQDFWLILVGMIDFVQTMVLLPLAFVIIYGADSPSDIIVNIVAVQIFACLDDDFVSAFANPLEAKIEALETYCSKKYKTDALKRKASETRCFDTPLQWGSLQGGVGGRSHQRMSRRARRDKC